MSHTLPKAMDLIKEAWQVYKKNFNTFLPPIVILALIGIVSLGVDLLDYPNKPIVDIIILIIIAIVSIWTSIVFIQISDKTRIGKDVDHGQIYRDSYARAPKYLWIYILYSLIIFGGLILLVVPAIIFAVWYVFSTTIVSLENPKLKAGEIFRQSKELSRGRFGATLWRLIAPQVFFGVIVIIATFGIAGIVTAGQMDLTSLAENAYVNLLLSLIAALFTPLMTLPAVSLFRELQKTQIIKS